MDLGDSLSIYRQRFADADDFTFVWVGNIDLEQMEPLAAKYLASLPVLKGEETWRDREIRRPSGEVTLDVRKGIDEKAQVVLAFWGPMEWNFRERFRLQSMSAALRIRLREALREDLGGTYGVGVGAQPSHYPEPRYFFQIVFGCDPTRVDDLIAVVHDELEALKSKPLDDTYLVKVKEGQLRQREIALKQNGFWQSTLEFYEWHKEDPLTLLEFEDYVNALTAEDIRATAEDYLDTPNHALFTLRPEQAPAADAAAE
jgi:zinc protease